jgi:hypothetical protein
LPQQQHAAVAAQVTAGKAGVHGAGPELIEEKGLLRGRREASL